MIARLAAWLVLLVLAGCASSGPLAPVDQRDPSGAVPAEITVARGETVFSIAERYGLSVRAVIEANGLTAPYALQPGQRLRLPRPATYVIRPGDTLSQIAQAFGTTTGEIARLNAIAPPYVIYPGRRLRLPSPSEIALAAPRPARKPQPPASLPGRAPVQADRLPPLAPPAIVDQRPVAAVTPAPARPPAAAAPDPVPAPALAPAPVPPGSGWIWPVRGPVVSDFGAKPGGLYNDGINIGAVSGTPVQASRDGTVAYAGNEIRGFGNLLLVRHEDGYVTAYAHLGRIAVSRGQRVRRGEPIGTVGATGNVAEPQLHFEIRRGSNALDPRGLLPDLAS